MEVCENVLEEVFEEGVLYGSIGIDIALTSGPRFLLTFQEIHD